MVLLADPSSSSLTLNHAAQNSGRRLPFANVFAQQIVLPANAPKGDEAALSEGLSVPGAERALLQLTAAYDRMMAAINVRMFNPDRLDEYIRRAEKRSGVDMTELEKDRLRRLAKSEDLATRRLLCLELRVGIPKKEEADAERAFGQLLLARHDRKALQRFLDNPASDENLKAHVRAVLMLGRVEGWMSHYEHWKKRMTFRWPVFSNN